MTFDPRFVAAWDSMISLGPSRERVLKLAKVYKELGMFPQLSHMQKANKIVVDIGFVSWNHFCAEYKD